jgi:hypothetical protein
MSLYYLRDHFEDIHTLEEEVTYTIECVFDHGEEHPAEEQEETDLEYLEHECIIPSLEVLVNLIGVFLCGSLTMALRPPIVNTGYLDAVCPRSVTTQSPRPFTTSITHHVG